MKKTLSNPDNVAGPVGPYSHLATVEVADAVFLYLAGQVAFDKEGNLIGQNNMPQQAEQVFENIKAILAASDATLADVIKITIFLTDMSNRDALRTTLRRYFPGIPPTSTLVQVSQLANPALLIEVEAVAVIAKK